MSILSWIYGDEENAKRAADADVRLRKMNQEAVDSGRRSAAWKAQVDRNYATQVAFGVEAQNAEIDSAFTEGLGDGVSNILGGVGKATRSITGGIPWWVWLLVVVVVFGFLVIYGIIPLRKK